VIPSIPVRSSPERHKPDCYLYAPTYFLNLNHDDYAAALDWCEGAKTSYESTCARGVGGETMKENMNDPKFVETTCMSSGPEKVASCIEGMVGLYINHCSSGEPATELCAELQPSNRRTCYITVQAYAGLFRT
jgi:hypothetical protein